MSRDPRLLEAEADVLAALFDAEEATARLRVALERQRPMAQGTVVTRLRPSAVAW